MLECVIMVSISFFWVKEFENLWIIAVEPLNDLKGEGHAQYKPFQGGAMA